MVDLYEGDYRALPIVQAIAGIAETERDRPVNPLRHRLDPPTPLRDVSPRRSRPKTPADAQAFVLAAIDAATTRGGSGRGSRPS